MKYFAITPFIALGLTAFKVQAAVLGFVPEQIPLQYSSDFAINVSIDTQGKTVNAIQGKVKLAAGAPRLKEVRDSNSIINFWVVRPELNKSEISFSGTVVGGYTGDNGLLFSLIFEGYAEPLNSGKVAEIANVEVLLNDGMATTTTVSTKALSADANSPDPLTSGLNDGYETQPFLRDNIPPEIFTPQISRSEELFDNQWFIVFSTTDYQSGISHYEIQETKNGKIKQGAWLRVSSPYLLTDQSLESYIYVIAVDNQGNERMIQVFPRNPQSLFATYRSEITVALGLLMVVLLTYFVTDTWLTHNKKKFNEETD